MPLLSEVVRTIKAEWEIGDLDAMRVDVDLASKFQDKIFETQLAKEVHLREKEESFVSDRGMDFVVYSCLHTRDGASIFFSDKFQKYAKELRNPDAFVFFVRPHKEMVRPDHDRSPLDLRWDEICRVDGALAVLLELLEIPHVVISCISMRERIRTVEAVLRRCVDKVVEEGTVS